MKTLLIIILLMTTANAEPKIVYAPKANPLGEFNEGTRQPIVMSPGLITTYHSAEAFTDIVVAKPEVADAMAAGTDKDITIVAKEEGLTTMLLMNGPSVVGNILIRVQNAPEEERVRIYPRGNLHGFYTYHCPPGKKCVRAADEVRREPTEIIEYRGLEGGGSPLPRR